jgi:hypothetical protein
MPAVYVNAVPVAEVSTKPAQCPKIVYCIQVVRNKIAEELNYYRVEFKRYTVSVVPSV